MAADVSPWQLAVPAIAALAGVVLADWRARARERLLMRQRTKAAARLVYSEFSLLHKHLDAAVMRGLATTLTLRSPSAWQTHGETLGIALADDQWKLVASADQLAAGMAPAAARDREDRSPAARNALGTAHRAVGESLSILEPLTRDLLPRRVVLRRRLGSLRPGK